MQLRPLRDIAAADRRDHLRWAVRVRWLAVGGFSTLALLAWKLDILADLMPPAVIGTAAGAVNALNHWCVHRGWGLRRVTALAVTADVVLITALILATGGARSPFIMLYVVQVVATALLVDLWIAAAAALASSAAVTAGLWRGLAATAPAPPDDAAAQLVWGLFLLYCLGLLTFLGGYIAELLRRSEGDLDAAQAVLRGTRQRLRQTEAQLVHSEKMRALGQFVAGIAHELNNPLAFVAANLDALRRAAAAFESMLDAYAAAPLPAAAAQALAVRAERERLAFWRAELPAVLDDCGEGTRRAADIVAALRVFARADSGETWTVVDLHERLDRVAALLRHRLPPGVTVQRAYGVVPAVECLPGQLDQVFVNVIANAIDAVGGAGAIVLRTSVEATAGDDARAVVQVTDTGPGIPAALQSRLFEPFFTTKPEGQGTGLGLAVSYGIVERHGGSIAFTCPPSGGTTVAIAIPTRRATPT